MKRNKIVFVVEFAMPDGATSKQAHDYVCAAMQTEQANVEPGNPMKQLDLNSISVKRRFGKM